MSQPELLTALREATPPAPYELRRFVLDLAGATPPPHRRRLGRRAALGALAFAALVAAAVVATVLRPGSRPEGAQQPLPRSLAPSTRAAPPLSTLKAAAGEAHAGAAAPASIPAPNTLPPPSSTRAQRYSATLRLRLADGAAVATAARRAVEIAQALGGFTQAFSVSVGDPAGAATVVLRVPRLRVGEAVARLSALGRVVGEHVSVSDLQGSIDATGLRIVRLERELAAAINGPQTPQSERLVAALTKQIVGLQRSRAATARRGRDATVSLDLGTLRRKTAAVPVHVRGRRGPFHDLGVAFRLLGIGAVYVLALATPLAVLVLAAWFAASRVRHRRDERLLSRS